MRQLVKSIVILLYCFGILVIVNGSSEPIVTASSENTVAASTEIYLPLIANQYDPSLGIPVFGVQMYGSTKPSRSYHPFLIESGASWLRINASWKSVEPSDVSPDAYKWASIDNNLAAAKKENGGLNLIVTIGNNPTWASNDDDGVIFENKVDDFAEFMGTIVERYDGDGVDDAPGSPVVLYWEIYNEPDSNNTQLPFRWGNDGAAYANMLSKVYPAVKAANPNAKVVLGGLAYDWFEDQGGPFVRSFLTDVLAAGGGNYFDVGNIHYYPAFAPNWTNDDSLGLLDKVNAFRNTINFYGFDKEIVITESGWHDNASTNFPSTPERQSRYVVQMFAESMAADLTFMIWWMLFDPGGFYPYNTGLVTNDSNLPIQEKLSYEVYKNAVAELETVHFERTLLANETGNSDLDAYLFQDNVNSRSLYVTWLNPIDTTATHPLRIPASSAIVRDSLANSTISVHDGQDGTVDGFVTVQVGNTPLYVEVDK